MLQQRLFGVLKHSMVILFPVFFAWIQIYYFTWFVSVNHQIATCLDVVNNSSLFKPTQRMPLISSHFRSNLTDFRLYICLFVFFYYLGTLLVYHLCKLFEICCFVGRSCLLLNFINLTNTNISYKNNLAFYLII